jgi:hypothetical protein
MASSGKLERDDAVRLAAVNSERNGFTCPQQLDPTGKWSLLQLHSRLKSRRNEQIPKVTKRCELLSAELERELTVIEFALLAIKW